MNYRNNKSTGFALIEVLISMVILGITLTGIGSFWVSAINESEHNFSRSQAMTIAMNVIEFVKANPEGWEIYIESNNWSTNLSSIGNRPSDCFSTNPETLNECSPNEIAMADIHMIREYASLSLPLLNGSVELRAPCFSSTDLACVIIAWMNTTTELCNPLTDGIGALKRGDLSSPEEFLEETQCVIIDFQPSHGTVI